MNISKEHIEALIFDYYEGNLSDSQKSELLNLIHQNPEFESDFALWAQTYAHVESAVPDYGLAASLLQKPVVAWYSQAWAKVGVSALVVTGGILGYWVLNKKSEPQTHFVPSKTVNILLTEAKENSLISIKPNTTKNQNSKLKIENEKKPNVTVIQESVLEKPVSENLQVETPKLEQTLEVLETSKVLEKVLEVEKVKPDSFAKTVMVEPQMKQEEKPTKKPKRKLPLNLKPSPDFMPVNPNF